MARQQHPRLRAVNFPKFPAYAESITHDTKTGYQSYSRAPFETDRRSLVRTEKEEQRVSVVMHDRL
jgi:hypothetical protein